MKKIILPLAITFLGASLTGCMGVQRVNVKDVQTGVDKPILTKIDKDWDQEYQVSKGDAIFKAKDYVRNEQNWAEFNQMVEIYDDGKLLTKLYPNKRYPIYGNTEFKGKNYTVVCVVNCSPRQLVNRDVINASVLVDQQGKLLEAPVLKHLKVGSKLDLGDLTFFEQDKWTMKPANTIAVFKQNSEVEESQSGSAEREYHFEGLDSQGRARVRLYHKNKDGVYQPSHIAYDLNLQGQMKVNAMTCGNDCHIWLKQVFDNGDAIFAIKKKSNIKVN